MEKLPEGTVVTATIEAGTLVGTVCGIVNELPVIGYTYIIKITQCNGIAFEQYGYSCIALPQSMFKTA